MRYGISAGALVLRGKKVLLVHHREIGSYDFWVPPGGSLEGDESIFDCARRETFEETGLVVEPQRIVYIQELVEPGYHFCKFYILCRVLEGQLSLANRDPGEGFVVDARFMAREELEPLTVYPPVMKGQFWSDLETGFQSVTYIGLDRVEC